MGPEIWSHDLVPAAVSGGTEVVGVPGRGPPTTAGLVESLTCVVAELDVSDCWSEPQPVSARDVAARAPQQASTIRVGTLRFVPRVMDSP